MNSHNLNHLLIQTQSSTFLLTQHSLGIGAFGQVQLGTNVVDGTNVAVKVISIDNMQQAQQEIKILKLLNQIRQTNMQQNPNKKQQNILNFFGSYRSYNWFYIVTECYGCALSTLLPKIEELNLKFAITTLKSVIIALQPLRQFRILHRDIKPANILLQYSQQSSKYVAKFCDFGLSIVQRDSKKSFIDYQRVGTLAYQSPEVIKFREYSQKSEIWSIGIVLYQILYKKLPFENGQLLSKDAFYEKLMTVPIKFHNIPQQIAEIGEKCLAINYKKRISFDELQQKISFIQTNLAKIIKNSCKQDEKDENASNKQINSHSFQSNTSTFQLSLNRSESTSRKLSEQTLQLPDQRLAKMLNQMFRLIKDRYYKIKRTTTKSTSPVVRILEKITNQNDQNLRQIINFEVFNALSQTFQKMKLVCEFSEDEKQITFNLNQFKLADCFLVLLNVLKQRLKDNKNAEAVNKTEKQLQDYLEQGTQVKSIHYYKELRKKVLTYQ